MGEGVSQPVCWHESFGHCELNSAPCGDQVATAEGEKLGTNRDNVTVVVGTMVISEGLMDEILRDRCANCGWDRADHRKDGGCYFARKGDTFEAVRG